MIVSLDHLENKVQLIILRVTSTVITFNTVLSLSEVPFVSLSWVSLDTRVTLRASLDHFTLSLVKSKLKCGELYLTESTSC